MVFLILTGFSFGHGLLGITFLLAGLPSSESQGMGVCPYVGVLSGSFGLVGMVWHRFFDGSLGWVRWITIALALLAALHVAILPLAMLQSYDYQQQPAVLSTRDWVRPGTLEIASGALHFLWLLILEPMPYSLAVWSVITTMLHVLPTKGRRRAMRKRMERSTAVSPSRSVIAACVFGWETERKPDDWRGDDEERVG